MHLDFANFVRTYYHLTSFATLRSPIPTARPFGARCRGVSRPNMRLLAADLRATGELRDDCDDETVADVVWSMNGAEYCVLLLHERNWSAERFAAWLADAWTRLLLASPGEPVRQPARRLRDASAERAEDVP